VSEAGEAAARRPGKAASAFRTISEVSEELDLPAHVLRFWESKFPQIKPLKRGGGRRYYRPDDVALLRRIRQCLYQDGYTIRGVQKLLREGALRQGARPVPAPAPPPAQPQDPAAPTLFPLYPSLSEPEPAAPPRGRRAPPREALREALEAVRRDLVEIKALLQTLKEG
jgi:DNA-binding transcriptional MerR regulator